MARDHYGNLTLRVRRVRNATYNLLRKSTPKNSETYNRITAKADSILGRLRYFKTPDGSKRGQYVLKGKSGRLPTRFRGRRAGGM